MNDRTNEQEVAQLFADFAAGSWEPTPEPTPQIVPPEIPENVPPTPKKHFNKKLFIAILAALVCVCIVAAYLLRPLPMQTVTLSISAGSSTIQILALRTDGTVAFTADLLNASEIAQWSDIASISAGPHHALGLKQDGTAVADLIGFFTGYIDSSSLAPAQQDQGQTQVSDWSDIVSVSAGAYHSVGLRKDGTVVAVGRNDEGQCNVSGWKNIVAISAGYYHTVGLKRDGTVVATVTPEGATDYGQSKVDTWTDIATISAGCGYTLGVRKDGTMVSAGHNAFGRCNVSSWTDIVSASAGVYHSVGLKKDGTVVSTELTPVDQISLDHGQADVADWEDMVTVAAGTLHTVGLTADGKVLIAGPGDLQSTFSQWTDIQIP